jgi:hypothetical protein
MGRSKESQKRSLLANTSPTVLTTAQGYVEVEPHELPILRLMSTFPPLPQGMSCKKLSKCLLDSLGGGGGGGGGSIGRTTKGAVRDKAKEVEVRAVVMPPPHAPLFNHLVLPLLLRLAKRRRVLVVVNPYMTSSVVLGGEEDGGAWSSGQLALLEREVGKLLLMKKKEKEKESEKSEEEILGGGGKRVKREKRRAVEEEEKEEERGLLWIVAG